ncbi:MAG: hypothetical protein ACOY0T_19400 [Myxococcota bacterium]
MAFPLTVSCGGSSGAYWDVRQKTPSYRITEPITLYVLVSDQVNAVDTNGAVLTTAEAIEAELRANGRRVQTVAGRRGEPPPFPRVELEFREFDGGNKVLRGAAGSPIGAYGIMPVPNPLGMAAQHNAMGRIVIDCYAVPRADGIVTFAGRVRGFVAVGEDNESAEEAGKLIAKELLNEG